MGPLEDRVLTRRHALRRVLIGGTGCALMGVLPLLESCGGPPPPPGPSVKLSRIPDGGRLVILDGELPIEISRTGSNLHARSLICTHQGCQVAWKAEENHYLCPCHQGIYDAEGRPIFGPPEMPLREFPVQIQGELVVVDTRGIAEGP
jgi:Rieske Fe-S protein